MTDVISKLGRERLWTHSRVLMLTAAFDGTIHAVNPAWTSILGWAAKDLVGRNFFDFVHPDDHERTAAEAAKLADGNQTPKFENRYRHADGDYRDIDWTAVSDSEFIHALGRDITTEKQNAEALQQAEDTLRQSQKMEAIGQLTGGVAHDFNNLLTVITGSVELLRLPNLSEERRLRYINAIGETAARATALTKQLLAFARRQALTPQSFDVGRSLADLMPMLTTLTGANILIEAKLPPQPYFIFADKSQFDTAIVNMALNARDAMDGEGRIILTAAAVSEIPQIRAHPGVKDEFIALTISDTGHGISPENLQRVFEPFFTTKGVGIGTGLGLSQVIGFAKQSGGEVRVESTEGEGTSFTMYLPHTETAPLDAEADLSGSDDVGGHGARILLVEDNNDVGEFAREALNELGYKVALARDGAAALAMLASDSTRYQVVFSDVVMPGMSGIELGREIRNSYPRIPVVLTSGYSTVLAQGDAQGFDLLQKPYSIEQLSRALGKAMSPQGSRN